MSGEDAGWMAYINAEVTAARAAKGWGCQVRRRWLVRETPVSDSPVEDYEWKLLPHDRGARPAGSDFAYEGVYYVLRWDTPSGKFVFQHDAHHGGDWGPHMEVETYTEISPPLWTADVAPSESGGLPPRPPAGWLRDHLLALVSRFDPNSFCVT